MRKPDLIKRTDILDAAARLFASRPFHEVRLDDIASAARVGKGTLYIYFESKEALYLSIIRDGFARVVERVRDQLERGTECSHERLGIVVGGLADFAFSFPELFRLMRAGVIDPEDEQIQASRRALVEMVEATIRRGVERGEMRDPRPELTAQFVLSFVRGVLLYPPPGLTSEALRSHVMRVLLHGVAAKEAA
jgi:AcrR family transcriptional regulator